MKEFYIDCDGIKLHAKLDFPEGFEKGPLCILIHGFTGHMEEDHIVAVQKAINKAGVAVLRAEMYGHGKSDGQFENHTLYKWVTNALAVVDYAKTLDFVTDLYLCGHSQGGLLTMLIGGMCNTAFKAIIPLSPAWMIPEICREGSVLDQTFDVNNIPETGPVLIVHGEADEVVPFFYGEKAAKLYKNAKLVPIKDDDHCYGRHMDEMADAVYQFFAEDMK